MLRAFFKDSVIYAIPSLVSRGLALILLPLYTRVLSPVDYGSLDLLVVFAGLLNLTVSLEVSQGVARFYAGEQDPAVKVAYSSSAFWFTVACYGLATIPMLVWAEPLAAWVMGQAGMTNAFRIGVAYILFNGLFYLIQNQLRWELRSAHYAIVSLTMSLITAAVSIWLGYGLRWGLNGLLIGMAIGSLAGCVLGLWWLRSSFRFAFDWARLREMLSFSAPLVVSGLAIWAGMYVDRLMINHLLTLEDVGIYGLGFRVASIATLAMIGFQSALTPLVYTHHREAGTPGQLARIFRVFFFCACIIFMLLALFAPDIVRLLAAPSFFGGVGLVVYLVPAMLLANMYVFAPGIGIAKKTHLLIWINIFGAVLNAVLNYFLIPLLGIAGAGWATLASCAVVFGLHMAFSQRLYPVPHRWIAIAIAAMAAGALAAGVPQLALAGGVRWVANALAVVAFAALAMALGLVRVSELRQAALMLKTGWRPSAPRTSA